MRSTKKSTILTDECSNEILSDCRSLLEKYRFSDDEIDLFLNHAADVLRCYREHFGEDAQLEYRVRKRFKRVELRLVMRGEKLSPLEAKKEMGDTNQSVQQALSPLVWNQTIAISHVYVAGRNVVTVVSPRIEAKALHRSPMLYAAILGLVCGLLCLCLPDDIRNVIVNDIAKPVQSVSLRVLTGVMAPVILFSMITAVSALGSINELTDLGFKIIGRFIVITLSVMAVGIVVSLFFYSVIGEGSADFQLEQLVDLVLGIIPTNILSPLLDGNIPQLVVLGLALGAALLMLEGKVDGLKDILNQVNKWIMSLMGIVMTIVPVIPFICIFTTVAQGSGTDLLNGWEFIVASYVAATICGAIKLVRVSVKYKVKAAVLWTKLKPLIGTAFAAANNTTMMKQEYEISERELGIKPEFSSFWIPMSQAMLNPRRTLMLVIPPFLILKYTGMPISTAFLLVLIILVLELSIASPGTTGGWTILFAALGLPVDYVGLFVTYRLACANYNAAYGALQVGLEQIEAASKFDAIDLDVLRDAHIEQAAP